MDFDVRDMKLAPEGKRRILWADRDMPVLAQIRERFEKERPLEGLKMGACLHVTCETANLARTLKAGGAELYLCASNPLSTQDDVAASLVKDFGIPTFAIRAEDNDSYYAHIKAVLDAEPVVTMDDGADLINVLHSKDEYAETLKGIFGSMEETTTGVIRLRAMAADGALKIPVFAVNDADTKYLFDNRYGTGQSTVDGIIRATDALIAGKRVVVVGYGWCGKGFANRVNGLGARVIVTEINPLRALEATMDGFEVMPMSEAAKVGEIFCTLTGNLNVIRPEHFNVMKDGAIVCNSGHFDAEIDIKGLKALAAKANPGVRKEVDEFVLPNGNRVMLLSEGRLINLSAAEGHPASVMDMSFATQALTTEFCVKNKGSLEIAVHDVPAEIEDGVSLLKLKAMGIEIDELTDEQRAYLSEWRMGT